MKTKFKVGDEVIIKLPPKETLIRKEKTFYDEEADGYITDKMFYKQGAHMHVITVTNDTIYLKDNPFQWRAAWLVPASSRLGFYQSLKELIDKQYS